MNSKEFEAGYTWAFNAVRFEGMTPDQVRERANDDHDFDRGAHLAMSELGDALAKIVAGKPQS